MSFLYLLNSLLIFNLSSICVKKLVPNFNDDKFPAKDFDGFLTSNNRYVGREEAWKIAKLNKQIIFGLKASDWDDEPLIKGLGFSERPKSILISENLY